MCFTNCDPKLSSEQLEILVKRRLGVPYYFVKRGQYHQIMADGKIEQVSVTERQVQDADIIVSVYFKADNYMVYDKETHSHVERQFDNLYKTKVGYVFFRDEVTEEVLEQLHAIETRSRTIFGQRSLQSDISKPRSLFVTGLRNTTDLQKLVSYVQKSLDAFQRGNAVRNLKTFVQEQNIRGFCYVELAEPLNDKAKEKLYNRVIEIPNQVKILKCLEEKKARKRVERVQLARKYQESLQRRKGGIVGRSPGAGRGRAQ